MAGVAPASLTARFHCQPDLDAVRRREPVRDDGGLERDHRPPVVEGSANLVRELDELVHAADAIGIAPSCWTQRAAASRATIRSADDPAGRQRVARARRVENLIDGKRSSLVAVERAPARAALEDPDGVE